MRVQRLFVSDVRPREKNQIMSFHGVTYDPTLIDQKLRAGLRNDHITRFSAVPQTRMINTLADGDQWLIVDSTYPDQIARRLSLLDSHRDWITARLPDDDVRAAEYELRDTVVSYMTQTYPEYFIRDGHHVMSPLTGLRVDVGPQGADPQMATLLLATEDCLLLQPRGMSEKGLTEYALTSGILAFPNGWSLTSHFNEPRPPEKKTKLCAAWDEAKTESLRAARLGKTPRQIHEGAVSHYMAHFADRVDMFYTRMEIGRTYWRRNWGPALANQLFRHADGEFPPTPKYHADLWLDRYLRSEHETFLKMPKTGAIIFGIKTYIWPVRDIIAEPRAFHALKIAFDNMKASSPLMWEYRAHNLPTFGQMLEKTIVKNPALKPD